MTEHTKTPWKILYKHDTHKIHRDKQGHIIDHVTVPFEDYYHAVECVNLHEELVNALELAHATIERFTVKHGPFSSTQGTINVIQTALAKVKGA